MVKKHISEKSQKSKSKNQSLPPQLHMVNLDAAGVDIGSQMHHVAVPFDRAEQSVREFGAFTSDLHDIVHWLRECEITTVAMESTGVYWIPLFRLLEEEGFEVLLVAPHKLKFVPGRKTDVLDCQWIQTLHTFGLLSSAFRPEQQVCVLRSYIRQRSMLVRYASNHIQHIQKALTQMNIKLQHVISDVTGVSGMNIILAILDGERDPHVLASLRDRRCKSPTEKIVASLEGNWRDEHLFSLKQAIECFQFYQSKIAECDRIIEQQLQSFEDQMDGQSVSSPPKKRGKDKNQPDFNVHEMLVRMTGVDLTQIDGIEVYSALLIVSEIGTDMSQWRNAKHFASWLGLCPGSKISGGRRISSQTRKCVNRVANILRLSANTLYNSKSALGGYLRRMKARLGAPKAITATAHKLARLIYSMLKFGTDYVDKGQEQYEKEYQSRRLANAKRNAKSMGYKLVPIDANVDS